MKRDIILTDIKNIGSNSVDSGLAKSRYIKIENAEVRLNIWMIKVLEYFSTTYKKDLHPTIIIIEVVIILEIRETVLTEYEL
ncbi:MAG: hypothetical protein JJV93_00685 [Alphaproteobacteria bacterium]|nr:hypothetical protein [Alphaproteobacteria bacterium]